MSYDPQSAATATARPTRGSAGRRRPRGREALLVVSGELYPAYVDRPRADRRGCSSRPPTGDARIVVEPRRGSDPLHPLDVLDGVDTDSSSTPCREWTWTPSARCDRPNATSPRGRDWRARSSLVFRTRPRPTTRNTTYARTAPLPGWPAPRLRCSSSPCRSSCWPSATTSPHPDFAFLAGVAGILVGAGLLIMRCGPSPRGRGRRRRRPLIVPGRHDQRNVCRHDISRVKNRHVPRDPRPWRWSTLVPLRDVFILCAD